MQVTTAAVSATTRVLITVDIAGCVPEILAK